MPGGHNSIDICVSKSSMESDSEEICHIDVSDIDIQDSISDTDDIDMATKCGCINDICGLVDTKFMIQAGVCYAEIKSLSDNVSVIFVLYVKNVRMGITTLQSMKSIGGAQVLPWTHSELRAISTSSSITFAYKWEV